MYFYDHIKTDEIRFPQIISRILIQKADYISPLGSTQNFAKYCLNNEWGLSP